MKVILNKDIKKIGYKGEIIEVKDGYFRNFLFPKNLASIASKKVLELAESRKDKVVLEKKRLLENIQDVLKKMAGLSVEISAKVTDKETLYAAVSTSDFVAVVEKASNVKLEESYVKFAEPVKTLGEHKVMVDFGEGHESEITLNVVKA
jgi:large subunit ribosomal protein L9